MVHRASQWPVSLVNHTHVILLIFLFERFDEFLLLLQPLPSLLRGLLILLVVREAHGAHGFVVDVEAKLDARVVGICWLCGGVDVHIFVGAYESTFVVDHGVDDAVVNGLCDDALGIRDVAEVETLGNVGEADLGVGPATVAATSVVLVLVMDCTAIGAPSPIGTSPT